MSLTKQIKLPIIKRRNLQKINELTTFKLEKQSSNSKITASQRWKRKLSLNNNQTKDFQKRCLSQKRFSLKKISVDKLFKNLKQSQANTHDNSASEKQYETFFDINQKEIKQQKSIKQEVFNLKDQILTINLQKIYQKEKEKKKLLKDLKKVQQNTKTKQKDIQHMKISKNKLKCLVNPHVFDRKSKHNNSDGVKHKKKSTTTRQTTLDDFWNQIDQSMILQCSKTEQPSKQLLDLVGCIPNQ